VRPMFRMARDAVSPYQAQGRFKTFVPGQALWPGLEVVDTHGHTPGHSSYLFRSGAQELLVWGDIVHSHAVQFAHPDVAIEFDTDPRQAIVSRRAVFDKMAASGGWVAAAHLPFPGLGHLRKEAQGYAWVPVEYGPLRRDR
jgi:glyoxylase-like metal-dependent hydrolase (beta-lactamase superfamily II)